MNSSTAPHSRSPSSLGAKPPGAPADSPSKYEEPEEIGQASLNDLRGDVSSLKDTVARLASQASGEAAKTVRSVSQTLASQVSGAASGVADAGSDLAA